MAIITVHDLRKEFKVYQHHEGLLGAIRNLASSKHSIIKAVDGISFEIQEGQMVEFETAPGKKGLQAKDVRICS